MNYKTSIKSSDEKKIYLNNMFNVQELFCDCLTVVLMFLFALTMFVNFAAAAPNDVIIEKVTFYSGDVELHGSIIIPAQNHGGLPGIVMVHGAGPQPGSEYQVQAEKFARAGIATLIYDKRTVGYSLTDRSYSILADDALAGVRKLQEHTDVDPSQVGLWGQSEGGWVTPLAASRSEDVAFLITVGASGVSPARQTAWSNDNYLRHAGVSGSLVNIAAPNSLRILSGAGLFAEADYNPVPSLEQVNQPVLALWGEHDQVSPVNESSQVFQQALERGDNNSYTIRIIHDAEHNMRSSADGFIKSEEFASDYFELVCSWVNSLPDGTPSVSIDPPPQQVRQSTSLAPLLWYELPGVQFGAYILLIISFVGYLLTVAVQWLRGHSDFSSVSRTAFWFAVSGMITIFGTMGYLFFTLLTSGRMPGPVFFNRAVPWLVLQFFALTAIVSAVITIVLWLRRRYQDTFRGISLLFMGFVIFVPWALYWGLFLP